jgi:hypothetical protein
MPAEIITKEDLELFRVRLLADLKRFLDELRKPVETKWLRSREVRGLLKISPGTLQNLRINGKSQPTKIGGTPLLSDSRD